MERKAGREDAERGITVSSEPELVEHPLERATPSEPQSVESDTVEAAKELSEEIPVPIAVTPAEIDERAQVVEAIRDGAVSPSREADRGARDAPDSEVDGDVRP